MPLAKASCTWSQFSPVMFLFFLIHLVHLYTCTLITWNWLCRHYRLCTAKCICTCTSLWAQGHSSQAYAPNVTDIILGLVKVSSSEGFSQYISSTILLRVGWPLVVLYNVPRYVTMI